MGSKYFGAAVQRREDPRLITGRGRYVADVGLPGALHAAFLRSPHAHARVLGIRTEAARALAGVVGVFTFDDLAPAMKPIPSFGAVPPALAKHVTFEIKQPDQLPMARDRVRYVGEQLAVVVARDRATAEDALDLIEVDYEPLPASVDMAQALQPGAPRVWDEWQDNLGVGFEVKWGDVERAYAEAPVTVAGSFRTQRQTALPMEPRGVAAMWDARDESITVWSSTQVAHGLQYNVATCLELPMHKVRGIAPDVGGGFGTKGCGYGEEIVIPAVARVLGKPVKWIEDRREHFVSCNHARDQVHDIEIAATREGLILAIRDRILHDLGAYNPWGIVNPYNSVAHLTGPYRVPALSAQVKAVFTNKTVNAPYRGAGRPEAVFAMDRIVDCLAREIGMDPAEVRRRNYVRPDEMPYEVGMFYRDGNRLVYDSGDFPEALESALELAGYDDFRAKQAELRQQGIYRGIGISGYVEGTGVGPFEGATVRLDMSGRVVVATGACSQGQAHETTLAQVAADAIGVPLEWVTVKGGDTDAVAFGIGTFASRSAVTAGNAVSSASTEVRGKLLNAASRLMEAAVDDLDIEDGAVTVRGVPDRTLPLGELVQACLFVPGIASAAFEATSYHQVPTVTYASAVHVAEVEVDPDTGGVQLLRYSVAHDCGKMINPIVVEGQVHGGTAQGIAAALLEEIVYDDAGQPLTTSLMDYTPPTAAEVPDIESAHLEFPSPRNPLGVKGLGEGGAISPPGAILNAIDDALAPFGVRVSELPASPARIAALVRAARS
ncbi:MAG TPA: xanthine dehydrogenase family protein molybdopterin-binding subunit [Chloroflexota bacterium]|nr:xanthine dehydrogenase family protein molybdopterin-binding subunit [Chloroflexota bacterium]